MPHFGQAAGVSLSTPGHMGQIYLADPFVIAGSMLGSAAPAPRNLSASRLAAFSIAAWGSFRNVSAQRAPQK
jgi:hypothetical protein